MSARVLDANGWYEIQRNPISKVGVFPYRGSQLGFDASDPRANQVFNVYRPASELSDPEAMDSFRLTPFVDEHTMLGGGADHQPTPAEKGVHGVLGDRVGFDNATGVLYTNLKVWSPSKVSADKREISVGYRCVYDFTPGVFDGKAYDAIQRKLRGNHGALVKEGRMGSDVAVLDHMTFTVDAKDMVPMRKILLLATAAHTAAVAAKAPPEVIAACDEAMKAAGDDEMAADAKTALDAANAAKEKAEKEAADAKTALDAANTAKDAAIKEAADAKAALAAADTAKPGVAADAAMVTAFDELKAANIKLNEELTALKAVPALDEAGVFAMVSKRDALVERLTPFVGVFDHKDKTLAQVTAYGIDKLGIKDVPAGHELTALDAYLAAKPVPTPVVGASGFATDGAGDDAISAHFKPKAA